MAFRLSRSRLDDRLVAEAIAIALHPATSKTPSAVGALAQMAEGNRTALERAMARVGKRLRASPSHVGERALELLRRALDSIDGAAAVDATGGSFAGQPVGRD
jgi:hypothetical protein